MDKTLGWVVLGAEMVVARRPVLIAARLTSVYSLVGAADTDEEESRA